MAKLTYHRTEIGSLAERLEVRGTSRLLKDRPELQSDLRVAAALLRFMLEKGMPPTPIEIENGMPPPK
jgi:hypothetical protein